MNHFIFAKLGKNPIYTFHPNYKSSKKVQVEVNRGKNGHESNDLFCRKKKPFCRKERRKEMVEALRQKQSKSFIIVLLSLTSQI